MSDELDKKFSRFSGIIRHLASNIDSTNEPISLFTKTMNTEVFFPDDNGKKKFLIYYISCKKKLILMRCFRT